MTSSARTMLRGLAGMLVGGLWLMVAFRVWAAEGDLSDLVARVRAATAPFLDVEEAQRAGYRQVTGMRRLHGVHYFNPTITDFDLTRPQMLLYVQEGPRWQLAGVEYVAATPTPPSLVPGAPWHRHGASCHYADGSEEDAEAATLCPPTHPKTGAAFTVWHPRLWSLHIWAWFPNPSGLFAETNPFLASYGGTEGLPGGGREHASWTRSPAQIAFSEFNHRSSGVLLTLVGLLAVVDLLVPGRRFSGRLWPLAAMAVSLWVLVRSDPQVWPLGPIPLREGLTIPSVWQHKVGGLLLLTMAGVELLRTQERLRHPAWGVVFPGLALLGGLLLTVHGAHASARHLGAFLAQQLVWGLQGFKIYLQHVAVGVLGLLIGVTKLLWDRHPGGSRGRLAVGPSSPLGKRLIWRLLLIAVGVLLSVYRER